MTAQKHIVLDQDGGVQDRQRSKVTDVKTAVTELSVRYKPAAGGRDRSGRNSKSGG